MTKTILSALASDWTGAKVVCFFTATADGAALLALDDSYGRSKEPIYDLPDGTKTVTITVKPDPTPSPYWEIDPPVEFSVASDGVVTVNPAWSGRVTLRSAMDAFGHRLYFANIRVSRFKDFTKEAFAILNDPARANEMLALYGAWPPPDWNLYSVPDAVFLDVNTPVNKAAGVLNFATDASLFPRTSPPKKLDVDSVVLKLANVDAPQIFAVTWPKLKAGDPATPLLLFFHEHLSQWGLDTRRYPDDFDFVHLGLFSSLHYGRSTGQPDFGPRGVPYQAIKAGVSIATVIPCDNAAPVGSWGVFAKGDTEHPAEMKNTPVEIEAILKELQAFMFWRAGIQDPPKTLGKTAIAAFSSANSTLDFLLRAFSLDKTNNFFRNTVRAVYFLDPPESFDDGGTPVVEDYMAAAKAWYELPDKRIRLYMHYRNDHVHKKLLGTSAPPDPYFGETSAPDLRSMAVVARPTWVKTFKTVLGPLATTRDWRYAHWCIAASMLTHALSHGDLAP